AHIAVNVCIAFENELGEVSDVCTTGSNNSRNGGYSLVKRLSASDGVVDQVLSGEAVKAFNQKSVRSGREVTDGHATIKAIGVVINVNVPALKNDHVVASTGCNGQVRVARGLQAHDDLIVASAKVKGNFICGRGNVVQQYTVVAGTECGRLE